MGSAANPDPILSSGREEGQFWVEAEVEGSVCGPVGSGRCRGPTV